MAGGGPLRKVAIDGRSFSIAGDGDSGRVLGGDQIEVESNGDYTARTITSVVPWMYDSVSLVIDDARQDLEFLQSIAKRNATGEWIPMSFLEATGITYRQRGALVGEVKRQGGNATAPVTFKGPGSLSQ